MKGQIVTGTVTGTGAAINVSVGFKPKSVQVFNKTDPGAMFWCDSMAAGEALKMTDVPALAFVTSNGISTYDGTAAGNGAGFTIGADADINAASDVLFYVAIGDD